MKNTNRMSSKKKHQPDAGGPLEVTGRPRAEPSLRESEARYRALAQSSPVGIWQTTLAGQTIYINPAGCAIFEVEDPSQMAGKSYRDFYTRESIEIVKREHAKRSRGVSSSYEVEVIGARGRRRNVVICGAPLFGPDGTVESFIGTLTDVTDWKLAQEALRASEERFAKAFQFNPTGLCITREATGDFLDANDAFLRIFGFERQELIGRTSLELRMWIEPEKRREFLEELRAKGSITSRESQFRRKSGETGVALHSLIAIEVGGEPCILTLFQDITEKRRAEQALQESQERFRQLAENIQEVFWMTDPEKNQMLYISPAYEPIWGRTCESLYQSPRDWLEAIDPEDRSRVLNAALTNQIQGTYAEEYRIIRPDGTRRWIQDRAFPIRDASGHVYRIVGVAADITDRKRSHEELRLSEARYRLLFESNPHPMWVFDLQTLAFLAVNDSAVHHYGYSRNEFLAMTIKDIRPPKDVPRLMEEVRAGVSSERNVGLWRHAKKDGTVIDVEVIAHPINFAGRAAKLVLASDLTERRRAEAALQESRRFLEKAQEVAHIGSWISSPDDSGRLTWSDEVYRIFGVRKPDFDGRVETFFAFVHPDDREKVRQAVARALTQRVPYDIEHRIVRPDASIRWVHEQADVNRDAEGKAVQLIGVVQDITEQKQLEEQLRQSQKLEAIGQLAGGVAHDFNNILTVIKGHASVLLGKRELPSGIEESLREILLAADRATNLTRQLLTFGRRQLMQASNLNVNEVVDNMSRMLRRILGEDIILEVQSSSNLPLIHADAGMVEQVLLNLAVNARDAMPRGGRLTIRTTMTILDDATARRNPDASAGPFVCLQVSDTGCGIAAEDLPRIFDPFFTTKDVGRGTGLGLATVYGIVRQHRGWIDVESELRRGTSFRVFLPGVPAPAEQRGPEAEPMEVRGGSEWILVVEDEHPLRELVRYVLNHYGYRVRVAASGVEALKVWQDCKEEIDLLLTDLVMPGGITGRELAVKLRREKPGLKVIFTTGYSPEIVKDGGRIEERIQLLPKPYNPSKLARMVRECLDG
ncbi:MAG: PAS domain S-box protein [Verrucomicrobia bacterium]|nr:PAS domain S-box protein [Verrucomicrobiota bacterium]